MVTQKTVRAECPDCGERVTIQGPIEIGRRVACPNCQADLEIVETVPVELDWYYEELAEDEDEDEDDDDW